MLAWACEPATEQVCGDEDGAVSPPYCAPCPLARTAVFVEDGGLAPSI